DAVLQGTRYDQAHGDSVLGEQLDTAGWGLAASLEAGYPFALGRGWSLEPQAQIVYQHVMLDDGSDAFGQVAFPDSDAVYGRLGARLVKNWSLESGRRMTGWAHADVWSSFGASAETTFSGPTGANPLSFGTDLGGTWGSFGLGMSGEVAKDLRLFASGDYNIGFDGGDSWSVTGRVGFKVVW
ncbi:autotransporter domain-containing protein, partial [Rhizobiaceae sp. 2RAB30]